MHNCAGAWWLPVKGFSIYGKTTGNEILQQPRSLMAGNTPYSSPPWWCWSVARMLSPNACCSKRVKVIVDRFAMVPRDEFFILHYDGLSM